ncbi:hypothetical protein BDQ94DRAFT_132446 [Aspergillus welwitschiae]|uniref:Uncharacterized protein n=1 Tax=Aspergillus welwitschiae TaxID=1341132 RepID=A0A3F3QJ70_9EURO|nr:hypothetical protein BDQ94DRAFT_132446 [Aspergillus welwitschiae]RDH39130.1 hypothetical protein BDQ94DRAFT_132446 [Aspergillus welwitschiae]
MVNICPVSCYYLGNLIVTEILSTSYQLIPYRIYESKICKEHVQIAKPHSDRSPQVTYSLDIHYTSAIEGNLLIAIGWQLGAWR